MTRSARLPPVAIGWIAGGVTFLVSYLLFVIWVHHSFAGRYDGPFLISERFGVPDREAARGVQPVCPEHIPGWDGQFYFHVANDPLGLVTPAQHFDNISYRYQRVGVPAVAFFVAQILGESGTPAFVYHIVQLLIIAIGAGVLAAWLAANGLSAWWVIGWIGAAGPLYTMSSGLPDGAGDAVFICTLVALWYRRLVWYVALASLLVLIREGYVIVAFSAFVATATGFLTWDRPLNRWKTTAIVALPGIVLILWAVYLWQHFDVTPWSADRNPAGLYGAPFRAFSRSLRAALQAGDATRFRMMLLAGITVGVVLLFLLRHVRASMVYICAIPYVLLTACLGMIVWEYPEGFLKASASVLVPAIFLLPKEQGVLLRLCLAANLFVGIEWNVLRNIVTPPFYTFETRNGTFADPPIQCDRARDVTDYRGTVRWIGGSDRLPATYQGPFRRWHREMVTLDIEVTNRSTEHWPTNARWDCNGVELGYAWLSSDGKRVIDGGWLRWEGKPPAPGETRQLRLPVRISRPGSYILRVAPCQGRRDWFDGHDTACGFVRTIRVE